MSRSRDSDRLPPKLDVDLQKHIGNKLKSYYDQVVNEPVPDRLLKLLEQLEAGAGKPATAEDGGTDRGSK